MDQFHKFVDGVQSGKIVSCEFVKQAVQRHLNDLDRDDIYFDEEEAQRHLDFFRLLRHTSGEYAGRKFTVTPFQAFIIGSIFGWISKDTGYRRFNEAYIEIGRKNGKTEFAAGCMLDGLIIDGEQGAQVFSSATTKEQASEAFKAAKIMAEYLQDDFDEIKQMLTIHKYNISVDYTNSFMRALSSERNQLDGKKPHVSIIDEFHAHKTSHVKDVMQDGMGSRRQPLQITITTAGYDKECPCYYLRKTCVDILAGHTEDDSTFAIIFTLDEDDDWQDEDVWQKANPNIGRTPYWDYMRTAFKKAKTRGGTKEVSFKTKNLNIWTDASSTWIQSEVWNECAEKYEGSDLAGMECWGGLDLASTRDLNALILVFPQMDEEGNYTYRFIYKFYGPRVICQERSEQDNVDYMRWAEEGYITLTPGNVTDYDYIKQDIIEMHEQFNVRSIAYDRYNSSQLVIDLQNEGFQMEPFGQGYQSMSNPTKEFEKLVYSEKIKHPNNPVMNWMLGNVELKMDPAENVKIDKSKSSEKVDGPVASVMAIGEFMRSRAEEVAFPDDWSI